MAAKQQTGNEHMASAKATSLSFSTKHSVEIARSLRYKNTSTAKKFLEEVIAKKKAVPFRRFNRDVGHKAGMSAGRYPQKAAHGFLKLINAVEANAQNKGLNTTNLKICKLIANKASIPTTGGRLRTGTKRTHIEIQVKERVVKKEVKKKGEVKKEEKPEVEEKKTPEVKEEKKVEVQEEIKKEKVDQLLIGIKEDNLSDTHIEESDISPDIKLVAIHKIISGT